VVPRWAGTDSGGHYLIAGLRSGSYTLTVSSAGFETYRRTGVEIGGDEVRIDVALALAGHRETVVVAETAVLLDANEMQVGQPIASAQAAAIPLNSRGFTDLLALEPGVLPSSSSQPGAVVMSGCTSAPPSGDLNPGNLSVNGQRETTNGFYVNGGAAQEDFNMGTAVVPNLDSIENMRVLTNTLPSAIRISTHSKPPCGIPADPSICSPDTLLANRSINPPAFPKPRGTYSRLWRKPPAHNRINTLTQNVILFGRDVSAASP